jgi:hypothetical protein
MDPDARKTQAAFMAANSAVAARFTGGQYGLHRRVPWPANAPAKIRPPALYDIPSLLSPPEPGEYEDAWRRVTRYSTAALLYAVERKGDGHTRRMLNANGELELLDHVANLDARTKDSRNETCSYCRIFNGLCYYVPDPGKAPDIEPLSHEARTTPGFDADTNVSEATLTGQQWLVRGPIVALQILLQSHPLLWKEAAPAIFQRSSPARERGTRPHTYFEPALEELPLEARFDAWTRSAESGLEYVWEDVTWPWNQDISSEISNVIRIEQLGFEVAADALALAYRYALESCVQSSFGVAFERSGLDVDGGHFRGAAKPISRLEEEDLKGLTARDLAHLGAGYNSDEEKRLYHFSSGRSASEGETFARHAREKVERRARELAADWGEEAWLVTTNASKRLRFTAPLNGPIELWAALTYSAPATLVGFLNQSTSLPAHQPTSGAIHRLAVSLRQRALHERRA